MNKKKRIICIILSALCFVIIFTSCGNKPPQEATTSGTIQNTLNKEISVIQLDKEFVFDYEWYGDTSEIVIRSEYTDVILDKAMEKDYPLLAKALSETSVMRKRAMEEEMDNFIVMSTDDFASNNGDCLTYVSTLDVQVRRADSVAVSILEDYGTESFRSFNGLNYDSNSGKLLALSDVVTDIKNIPEAVEKELQNRIGQSESDGETAIPDYFSNTDEDSITWVIDYNGITFYFEPGAVAPTNFGIQVVTVNFAQYPDLFNKKYTTVPDSYVVSLPESSTFFIDITGDKETEEIVVSSFFDDDTKPYHTISLNSVSSDFKTAWFSLVDPYYVRTSDGKSYICIYNLTKEEDGMDSTLVVYGLENGEVKLIGVSETGLNYKGNNLFALPTNPDSIIKTVKN